MVPMFGVHMLGMVGNMWLFTKIGAGQHYDETHPASQ